MKSLFSDYNSLLVRETTEISSSLEKLLDVEEEIIKIYLKKYLTLGIFIPSDSKAHDELISNIKQRVGYEITEDLLRAYLSSRENRSKDNEAHMRGIFSSALLELAQSSKNLPISLNLQGRLFNYLFYGLTNVKNITLENVQGDDILGNAGSFGTVENIIVKDICGERLLCWAGSNKGHIKNIIGTNIRGINAFSCLGGENGFAENITAVDVYGNFSFSSLGCDGEGENGQRQNVHSVVGMNLFGNKFFSELAYEGYVKNIFAYQLKGRNLFDNFSFGGKVEDCFIFPKVKLFLDQSKRESCFQYEQIDASKQESLDHLMNYAKTICQLPVEERANVHEKIARLHGDLFS